MLALYFKNANQTGEFTGLTRVGGGDDAGPQNVSGKTGEPGSHLAEIRAAIHRTKTFP